MDVPDGGTCTATVVVPDAGSGPGIVLFQEIFGVNDFLLAKANDLADLGYVVLCPDVFWRIAPGTSLTHDEAGLAEGFRLVQAYGETVPDADKVADLRAAVGHLRSLAETTGPVASMGYCLGGTLAYRAASHVDVDACVSYYGSGVAELLAAGERPSCPSILHFGGKDPFIPEAQVEAVIAGFASRPDVEIHVQPGAGHAFENFLNPQFSDLDAAAISWPLTTEFLARHLQG